MREPQSKSPLSVRWHMRDGHNMCAVDVRCMRRTRDMRDGHEVYAIDTRSARCDDAGGVARSNYFFATSNGIETEMDRVAHRVGKGLTSTLKFLFRSLSGGARAHPPPRNSVLGSHNDHTFMSNPRQTLHRFGGFLLRAP